VEVPLHIAQGLIEGLIQPQESQGLQTSASKMSSSKAAGDAAFHQDMLRKLALHLAAQPDDVAEDKEKEALPLLKGSDKMAWADMVDDEAPKTRGDAQGNSCESKQLISELQVHGCGCATQAQEALQKLLPAARSLCLTPEGSRALQQTIEVASAEQRSCLLKQLLVDVEELYMSPHANHVLARLVETVPATSSAMIAVAMKTKATTVARHRFGSRILERLVEHCSEEMIGFLIDELLEDIEALARHQFGNFVVARILEHAAPAKKQLCIEKLLPHVLQHATHKTACNIVERMLDSADLARQSMIADAFLAGTGDESLEAIASTRYGSFVIQHLVSRFHPRIDAVKMRVKEAHSQLKTSGFSHRKIVQFLGETFFSQ